MLSYLGAALPLLFLLTAFDYSVFLFLRLLILTKMLLRSLGTESLLLREVL